MGPVGNGVTNTWVKVGTEGDSEQKNDIIWLRFNRISLGSPVAIFVLELHRSVWLYPMAEHHVSGHIVLQWWKCSIIVLFDMVTTSGHCVTEMWLEKLKKWIFNFIRPYSIYTLQPHIARIWASLMAQLVKNPPSMWETWVWSLGWEDPLEKGTATHSRILAWRISWTI